jgi:hypothetical protein
MTIDTALKQWATVRQAEYIDAVNAHGSARKAAAAMNVAPQVVTMAIRMVKKKAAMQGFAPENDMKVTVPEPYVVRGTSTLYDADGKPKLQWVKTRLDETKAREAVEEWVGWLVEDAKGLAPVITPPAFTHDDLLTVYPMGDPHFGMYAWAPEAGDDFDLDIAERLTYAAIDRLVASAPPSKHALILELGDFFHADDNSAATPKSGNRLDVDTRWARVMQVGLRAMVYVIKRALEKHELVTVRIVAGNHDPHSSFALALGLDAYFNSNERVTIDLDPNVFWYYKFGKVLIGATHGDTCKTDKLPAIMACDRSEDWGQTRFRYYYHGHIHHDSVKELPGCMVESFRTLAARDAWHSGAGYRSGRDMRCIVHHKDFGEIERHRCDVAMLEKRK